ncbi:hypothetical protein [Amycolatopsis sp.]|uniref:hypothetical protein n=1 Tax=Amycolatopsis sp. TaxID=37632 RepID=UPI002BFFDCA8|nr:hypothetical protein [Amycolatopsis sp.]HVV11628.1 hypothetical protein [Amycolatopsis sp.]
MPYPIEHEPTYVSIAARTGGREQMVSLKTDLGVYFELEWPDVAESVYPSQPEKLVIRIPFPQDLVHKHFTEEG